LNVDLERRRIGLSARRGNISGRGQKEQK
jgi:hypothetical protein